MMFASQHTGCPQHAGRDVRDIVAAVVVDVGERMGVRGTRRRLRLRDGMRMGKKRRRMSIMICLIGGS